jgi:hypothetical protein
MTDRSDPALGHSCSSCRRLVAVCEPSAASARCYLPRVRRGTVICKRMAAPFASAIRALERYIEESPNPPCWLLVLSGGGEELP